jgi:hypothetical protein
MGGGSASLLLVNACLVASRLNQFNRCGLPWDYHKGFPSLLVEEYFARFGGVVASGRAVCL